MKIAPHKFVGWGLVAVFSALTGWILVAVIWPHPSALAATLCLILLAAGLLLLPAIMVLKRQWEQVAAVVSGLLCLGLLVVFVPRATRLVRWLDQQNENHTWWPFAGLIILISAWALPFKLHAFLKPRLQRWFARAEASAPSASTHTS